MHCQRRGRWWVEQVHCTNPTKKKKKNTYVCIISYILSCIAKHTHLQYGAWATSPVCIRCTQRQLQTTGVFGRANTDHRHIGHALVQSRVVNVVSSGQEARGPGARAAMAGATNEPWHSREPFVSLQARWRWALVAREAIELGGPVKRTLSPSAGPKRFSSRGVLLVAVIHTRSAKG